MRRLLMLLFVTAAGFLAGMAVSGRSEPAAALVGAEAPRPQAPARAPASGGPDPGRPAVDFTDVAERTVGAVTNISALQVVRRPLSPFMSDPFFRYFFGDDDQLFGGRSRREASLGSGVVVSSDGYILTNNHVVGNQMQEISVALADKRELRARLVGVDEWTDLALVKVDATDLPAMPWGDSSALRIAEWVLAIGNPFQLSQTVTLGIISAVGRANVGIATYEDFIQTDAAINPGNSGGALVNARGELVGINTAIYSQSGGYQGVGFAVPSNLARRVMDDLIRHGEVRRGSIGYLELAPLTTHLVRELQLDNAAGALVTRMRRDSEAYRAGIRPGDVIITLDDAVIDDPSHLLRVLSDAPIDSVVRVGLVRGPERLVVEARVSLMSSRRP